MSLAIIEVWTCDYCGAQESESVGHLVPGVMAPICRDDLPYAIAGWRWVKDKLACPRHDIVVKEAEHGSSDR